MKHNISIDMKKKKKNMSRPCENKTDLLSYKSSIEAYKFGHSKIRYDINYIRN